MRAIVDMLLYRQHFITIEIIFSHCSTIFNSDDVKMAFVVAEFCFLLVPSAMCLLVFVRILCISPIRFSILKCLGERA